MDRQQSKRLMHEWIDDCKKSVSILEKITAVETHSRSNLVYGQLMPQVDNLTQQEREREKVRHAKQRKASP
jgi:hypothetical protein